MGCGALTKVAAGVTVSRTDVLRGIVLERQPSIVALQEAPASAKGVLQASGFSVHTVGCLALGLRCTDWMAGLAVISQERLLAVEVPLTSGHVLLICDVHLTSRVRSQQIGREEAARAVAAEIQTRRKVYAGQKCSELVVGDFNLNPHDIVMMQPSGFFANRSKTYVAKTSQKVVLPKKPLYNPSWHIYGRSDEPLGSIYSTSADDGPWLVFDQLLMSSDLVGTGSHNLAVVTTCSGIDLLSRDVRQPVAAVGSDHLPLVGEIVVP